MGAVPGRAIVIGAHLSRNGAIAAACPTTGRRLHQTVTDAG
jgi:hypothetical protein